MGLEAVESRVSRNIKSFFEKIQTSASGQGGNFAAMAYVEKCVDVRLILKGDGALVVHYDKTAHKNLGVKNRQTNQNTKKVNICFHGSHLSVAIEDVEWRIFCGQGSPAHNEKIQALQSCRLWSFCRATV